MLVFFGGCTDHDAELRVVVESVTSENVCVRQLEGLDWTGLSTLLVIGMSKWMQWNSSLVRVFLPNFHGQVIPRLAILRFNV